MSGPVLEYMWVYNLLPTTAIVSALYDPPDDGPADALSCPDLMTCYCDV